MKKNYLIIVALLLAANATWAEDNFSVNALTIPQGGEAELEIVFESETAIYNRFQLDVEMPSNITYVQNTEGDVTCAKGTLIASTDHVISASHFTTVEGVGKERFVCVSLNNRVIPAGKGVVMTVTYHADASLNIGTTLTGYVKNVIWNDTQNNEFTKDVIPFTITIGEPRIVFDETSTSLPTLPTPATNVDVRVKRTIKANEWSTICLPFAMSEGQVQAAFGEDVQLAELKSWEEVDDDAIAVTFSDVAAIEANTPYVLKVSKQITEFTVDGVDVDPEEEPAVTMGKMSRGTFASFTGSYVPVYIDEECLFLSDNKFWYSTGKTRMKGYRAYFYFQTVVSDYSGSEAKVRFFIDDTATNIEGISSSMSSDAVYSVNGVRMGTADKLKTLPKGLYIVNGKKVIIK